MTVTTTLDREYFPGNGATTNFPFNFRFFTNDQIFVSLIAADGTVTPQTITTNYTLTGANSAGGGIVVMIVPPPLTATLFVQRILPLDQPTSIRNQGAFFPEIHENVFDRLTMLIQQLFGRIGRALEFPASDPSTINTMLPQNTARANKVLAFDSLGDPVVSNMTLTELEQQPANAAASAAAAAASASASASSATAASGFAVDASDSAADAAAIAAQLTGAAVFLHAVEWWGGVRAAIPAGYVPADGQTLSRALYPDAWASINAGNMPTVADATWNSTPSERGKYTTGNGTTTFRVPDYNGKFAGSIAAPFLRGDGALSAVVAGVIQSDQFQGHTRAIRAGASSGGAVNGPSATSSTWVAGDNGSPWAFQTGPYANDGTNGTPRVGSETRPTNVTGCFIIKLFGAVTNQGAADAALLATELASLTSRVTTLENGRPFTKEFISAEQTYSLAGGLSVPHGLGVSPKLLTTNFICKTAEAGYSAGDIITLPSTQDVSATYGVMAIPDATNIVVRFGSSGVYALNKTSGTPTVTLTTANWRLILRAWA